MFTGIVVDIGKIIELHAIGADYRIRVQTRLAAAGLQLGGSIAVNGVCLTMPIYRQPISAPMYRRKHSAVPHSAICSWMIQ